MRDRRRTFARPGGSHDKLVRFLATWLPAGIGVLAAIMILAPLSQRDEISFLLDRNKVEVTQERLRVDKAMYRGIDNRDRAFSVTAGSAVQRSADEPVVRMDNLIARLLLSDGPAEISAQEGSLNIEDERLFVPGYIDFRAADGYRMVTRGVSIDLNERRVVGAGGVEGVVPAGTFRADRITADLGERTVTLDGNARLQMQPGKVRMPR